MIPTACQAVALQVLGSFIRDEDARLAVLTGFAGAGKTSLLKLLVQLFEATKIPYHLMAPTGKAALRLREVTGRGTSTIHRFLYTPFQNPETGDVKFALRQNFEDEGAYLLVDEASMVGRKVWTDLTIAAEMGGMKILLVGDPFQLEPVSSGGEDDVFCPLSLVTPYRAHLDEVVRQALDSPVLRAATMIRAATSPMDVSRAMGELTMLLDRTPAQLAFEEPSVPVLVHRNVTRHQLNNDVRQKRGFETGTVLAGEPLLVMKNVYRPEEHFNGEIVQVGRVSPNVAVAVLDRRSKVAMDLRYCLGDVEGVPFVMCPDEVAGVTQGQISEFWVSIGAKDAVRSGRLGYYATPAERPTMLGCNYGYALTVHKAQGSEYDAVCLVVEPSIKVNEVEGKRFLYTAITRARKQVWWTWQ